MPHANILELTIEKSRLSYNELISIASNKKKGFTLTCRAKYEDLFKAIIACPFSFFISSDTDGSIINLEDAIDAIYGPMKTSIVTSDDPFERIYNKKGFKLALKIDETYDFKFQLKNFFTPFVNPAWSLNSKSLIDTILELDKKLVRMCLLDFKILKRWIENYKLVHFNE